MGNPATYTGIIWDTGLIEDSVGDPASGGGYLCNNCHEKESMNTKNAGCATGGGCHSHGAVMGAGM